MCVLKGKLSTFTLLFAKYTKNYKKLVENKMKLIVSYPGYVARHMCIVKWTPKDSVRKAVLK